MTQPQTAPATPADPWAAASAAAAAPAPASTPSAGPENHSAVAAAYGPASGSSLLFNSGAAAPSLLNKTHFVGTARTGIIKSTQDKQDQDFNAKKPKYWSTSKVGGETRDKAITTDPIDQPTQTPNRPVMVTHVLLATEYRMDQNEALAVERDPNFGQTDNGDRVEVVGGFDFKPFAEAMVEARARGIALNGPQDLVGKRLTVTRAAQKPNPGGNPTWIKTYRIDNA